MTPQHFYQKRTILETSKEFWKGGVTHRVQNLTSKRQKSFQLVLKSIELKFLKPAKQRKILKKSLPTIEGRKLIIQMVVGGMTQYLTQVQGMPASTEKKLEKRIRKFIWGNRTLSPVNIETLYAPTEMGGRGLLDIKSRNEAIDLMWLKSYLKFNRDRPLWALVADALMAINLPKSESSSNKEIRQSVFLQSWKTLTGTKSPKTIKKLFQTAKKFNVQPEGLAFNPSITTEMPIWHHVKADPKIKGLAKNDTSKCLMNNHKALKVGDIEVLVSSLENEGHTADPNCLCENCIRAGDISGCENPHGCYKQAEKLLNLLPSKWNPKLSFQPVEDIIVDGTEDPDGLKRQYFNGKYETSGTIADAFRAFTEVQVKTDNMPQKRTDEGDRGIVKVQIITRLTMVNAETKRLVAAIYYGKESPRNSVLRFSPPDSCEQEIAALTAIRKAVKEISTNTLLHIETNCKRVIKMLTSQLHKLEEQGFLLTQYPDHMQALVAELKSKKQETSFLYKSFNESTSLEAEAADLLNEGIDLESQIELNVEVNPEIIVSGAKLNELTQATAYKIIRSLKMNKYQKRRQTKANVAMIIQDVNQAVNITLREKDLWYGIRCHDLSRTTRVFLWMAMHDAYMIGTNWLRPGFAPEYQDRSECHACHTTETMDHILTKCQANGQVQVWQLAQKLWFQKDSTNLITTLGTILANPSIMIKGNRKQEKGANRLYRLIMSESAHLIWKVRCERVIQKEGEEMSSSQIKSRWIDAMNARLELDRMMTNSKYEKKSIPINLVQSTWKNTLRDEEILPKNWVTDSGVLVGIDLRDDDGRGRDRPPTPGLGA